MTKTQRPDLLKPVPWSHGAFSWLPGDTYIDKISKVTKVTLIL